MSRSTQQTPTGLDAWDIQQVMVLHEQTPETLHQAQLTAAEVGTDMGLSPQEIKEELLAPLGLEGRQVA